MKIEYSEFKRKPEVVAYSPVPLVRVLGDLVNIASRVEDRFGIVSRAKSTMRTFIGHVINKNGGLTDPLSEVSEPILTNSPNLVVNSENGVTPAPAEELNSSSETTTNLSSEH